MPDEQRRVDAQLVAHQRPALERAPAGRPARGGGGDAPGLADRRLAAGQRHRLQVGDALEAGEVAAQELAAPERAVGAVARAVEDERRAPAPVSPCSARQAAAWAWWCWTPTSSASCSSAHFVDRYSGCRSCAIDAGVDVEHRQVEVEISAERRGRRARCRGRRGAARGAPRSPRATQKVLFSSAPTATSGRGAATGSGNASGA